MQNSRPYWQTVCWLMCGSQHPRQHHVLSMTYLHKTRLPGCQITVTVCREVASDRLPHWLLQIQAQVDAVKVLLLFQHLPAANLPNTVPAITMQTKHAQSMRFQGCQSWSFTRMYFAHGPAAGIANLSFTAARVLVDHHSLIGS